MARLDHENAGWAQGAKLMDWLDGVRKIDAPTATERRRLERWRKGGQANYYDVDDLLLGVGLYTWEVPEDVWCAYDNGRRKAAASG